MSILVQLFRHNLWANLRLYDACADLTEAQMAATVEGTHGSIEAMLKHIAGAEERYVEALRGTYGQAPPRERLPFPGVAALKEVLRATGQALVDLSESTAHDAILRGVRRGEPFELPAWLFFLQALNHATDHRSQIATALTQQGIQPPDMDGWAFQAEVG